MADAEDSKIWNEEDEVWREIGEPRTWHLFFFYSLRFPNSEARWLSWSRQGFSEFEGNVTSSIPGHDILFTSLHFSNYFLFSFILIFCIQFNFFSIFYFMHLKIPKIYFLLHLFSENTYLIYKIKKYYFACIFIVIHHLAVKLHLIRF